MANDDTSYDATLEYGEDPEFAAITSRSADLLRRVAHLDEEFDQFVASAIRWTASYNVDVALPAILLRLVMLPPHIHEVDADQPSQRAVEYGELERKATSLVQRKRALELELIAVHDDFHAWADRTGAQLTLEESTARMNVGQMAGLSGAFGLAVPLPPNGYVMNSISCRETPEGFWLTTRRYCKIKKKKNPPPA